MSQGETIFMPVDLLAVVRRHGLDSVEHAFAFAQAIDLTRPGLGHRSYYRLELDDEQGRMHILYMKRYEREPLGQRLRRWWTYGPGKSPASVEMDNVRGAVAAGLPGIQHAYCNEQRDRSGVRRSYILLSEVPGVALEHCAESFLDRHAARPEVWETLTDRLADLVGDLHRSGWVHRDLYTSHIYLDESGGDFCLRLIDQARMFRPRWLTFRWRVKDLAQLLYTMPPRWTQRYWERFLAGYFRRMGIRGWGYAGAVARKERRMRRRLEARARRIARRRGRRRVNVAMAIERMDPRLGGQETYTRQVAEALAGRGVNLTILCQAAAWSDPRIRVVELGRRGRTKSGRLANFVADLRRAAPRGAYDIVHSMLPLPGADIYQPHSGTLPAQRVSALRRHSRWVAPLTLLGWRFNAKRRLLGRLEGAVASDESTCCLCVSPMVAREFQTHYGRTRNVRVILNGAKTPPADDALRAQWRRLRREELGAGADCLVLITVANNFQLKGVDRAVEAFALWRRGGDVPPARLIVLGGSPRAVASGAALARRCGVGDSVRFLGRREDIFEWYAAADAGVLLSWYDSCGLVVLEALRWGIPSILSGYAGVAQAIAGAGIVVGSPADTAAVVNAYREIADPARREALARACLDLAPALTLDRHVDDLIHLYQEIRRP